MKSKILPIVLIAFFCLWSVAQAVGGLLTPGGGGLMTPPVVAKSGMAVVPAVSGDTFGDFSNLWNGYFSTIYASTTNEGGLQTKVLSNPFNDASTTLFAVNPFYGVGTSTVDLANLDGNNGTTSTAILCGTSTQNFVGNTNLASPNLVNAQLVSTSSPFYLTNGVTIGSGSGFFSPGVTQARIEVGPTEWVLCQATSSYAGSSDTGLQGILFPGNTFSGNYKVRFMR